MSTPSGERDIKYVDKSKTGTFKLGRVESIEVDSYGLVRTCLVQYRLVRSDQPIEELRIYFKGLQFKNIRVPVQRLVIILPIEEQEEVHVEQVDVEKTKDIEIITDEDCDIEEDKGDELKDKGVDVENDSEELVAHNYWVESYRKTILKNKKEKKISRTVKELHKNISLFLQQAPIIENDYEKIETL